jgi:hypothetical protein
MNVAQLDDLHRHSLWSTLRHSARGVAKPRPLRLARLIAVLTNANNQQPPSSRVSDQAS